MLVRRAGSVLHHSGGSKLRRSVRLARRAHVVGGRAGGKGGGADDVAGGGSGDGADVGDASPVSKKGSVTYPLLPLISNTTVSESGNHWPPS